MLLDNTSGETSFKIGSLTRSVEIILDPLMLPTTLMDTGLAT